MSHYAQSEENTISYQYTHSTPPRRPSAGVSRYDSVPLPAPLPRTDFSPSPLTIPIGSTRRRFGSNMSFFWRWNNSVVEFDDREKMALVTDEGHDSPKASMKPWEGWRVVFLGSCRVATVAIKFHLLMIPRAQPTTYLPPCFREYPRTPDLACKEYSRSGLSRPYRKNHTRLSLPVREIAILLFLVD